MPTIVPNAAVTVGTVAAQLAVPAAGSGVSEVVFRSAVANTAVIYIGDATVTNAGGGNVFTQLSPGDGFVLSGGANPNASYVVAAAAAQTLFVGVVA